MLASATICERGFSKHNWVKSDCKSRLKLERLDALMRVSSCNLLMGNMDRAKNFDTWKSTKKNPKGFAFEVGWRLSALCRESKYFKCIILLHVLLQHSETSYNFHINTKRPITSSYFLVKCDGFETRHIEMHVHTSNLNTAPHASFHCCVGKTGALYILRQKANMPTPKHRRQLTTWQVSIMRGDFTAKIQTANLFLEIWVSLCLHPII